MGAYTGLIGDDLVERWLDVLTGQVCFASLHAETPVWHDPTASEVPGGTYTRPQVFWERVGARMLANANTLEWSGLDAGAIAGVGVFTAPVDGQLWLYRAREQPYLVARRGSFQVAARTLYLRIP